MLLFSGRGVKANWYNDSDGSNGEEDPYHHEEDWDYWDSESGTSTHYPNTEDDQSEWDSDVESTPTQWNVVNPGNYPNCQCTYLTRDQHDDADATSVEKRCRNESTPR